VIGLMPLSEALAMWSPDADHLGCGSDVADVLDLKRRSPGYPQLLDDVHAHGITVPVHVGPVTAGFRKLLDGHHRIAAAADLGLAVVPWTTVALDVCPA